MAIASQPAPERDDGKNLTILEHLQELRNRLLVCAIAVVLSGMLSLFLITNWVLRWLKEPAESRVSDFELVFTKPLEYWSTYFSVSLQVAIAISMPVLIYEFLAFVGPGLTRNEKRWAYPIILAACGMFVVGVLFAYYIEMPPALHFLLNGGGIARPLISVQSYIDFATKMMMVTGFVFETPFIVMALAKIGIVHSRKLLGWWRFSILGAFVISAVITPSIDPITQTLVALPMIALYFVGIALARLVESTPIIPRV